MSLLETLKRRRTLIARLAVVGILGLAAADLGRSNPQELTLVIPLQATEEEEVQLRILSGSGEILRARRVHTRNNHDLTSVFELPPGSYILEVSEGSQPSRRSPFEAPADAPIRLTFE